MKNLLLLAPLFLLSFTSFAQNNHNIRGIAIDSVSEIKLTATVTVLNAKDSILLRFTHAAYDGSFSISGLAAGKVLLLITYPGYADYVKTIMISPAVGEYNLGHIKLTRAAVLLHEVTIKGSVTPIKIKGDTIEFNAKAYVVQPNDKVEDLLKQLPGVKIDKDGHITADGERVYKVLLDGEEFFGDDPILITRNIRADMVDKIQLYNKKTDQATLTGVDEQDGKNNKCTVEARQNDRGVWQNRSGSRY